jgi:hypothetical protein
MCGSLVLLVGFLSWPTLLRYAELIFGVIMPAAGILTAGILAMMVVNDEIASEQYTALRLTPIPDREILQGFLMVALFRIRFLVALLVSIVPILSIGRYLDLLQAAYMSCLRIAPVAGSAEQILQQGVLCVDPSDPRLLLNSLLLILPLPVLVLCCTVLNTMLGVDFALAGQRPPVFRFLLVLAGPCCFLVALFFGQGGAALSGECLNYGCYLVIPPPQIPYFALISSVLACGVVWLMLKYPRPIP